MLNRCNIARPLWAFLLAIFLIPLGLSAEENNTFGTPFGEPPGIGIHTGIPESYMNPGNIPMPQVPGGGLSNVPTGMQTDESEKTPKTEGQAKLKEAAPSAAEKFFNAQSPAQDQQVDAGRSKAAPVALKLEQLGYDFFIKGVGFKPDPMSLVGPDYVIGPGDT
ncbi:MAG: hypothetical protein KJP07_15000, partial [Desulfatitalea sp.]|nr:hypothetical protein [Desulfatitalea sp.]